MLKTTQNKLLFPDAVEANDQAEAPAVMVRPRRKRELIDMRRAENARKAIEPLTRENELYGFTKGQFSVLDLITACLERTGPAHFAISTWTAARKEIVALEQLHKNGLILSSRWLIDYTFARRDKSALAYIRQVFGTDSVRVTNTHSKFSLFHNDEWKLVLRGSFNLNMNPRNEDFTLSNDPECAAFLGGFMDDVWGKQESSYADTAKPGENLQEFLNG